MLLTFTEYLAPVTFKSGKTGPARWKAGGTDYLLAKGVTVEAGQSYECVVDTTHSPDGVFTNHTVKSAVIVPATAPESAAPVSAPSTSAPSSTEAAGQAIDGPAVSPKPDVQMLIVRQSCLKSAVELTAGDYTPEEVFAMADRMVDWVYLKPADVNHAPEISRSPAAQHLEDARQKAAGRPDYDPDERVCGGCGSKDHLILWAGGWFCERKTGGCGWPPKGERVDLPPKYSELLASRDLPPNLRRPDAPVVSPSTHPTR
jgi:hypothetical protein